MKKDAQLSVGVTGDMNADPGNNFFLLSLIADIREAVGDPRGRLMQDELVERCRVMRDALERLRDCDWVITLPDRMDAVREIAAKALEFPAVGGKTRAN